MTCLRDQPPARRAACFLIQGFVAARAPRFPPDIAAGRLALSSAWRKSIKMAGITATGVAWG
jgi:hypothetical protein